MKSISPKSKSIIQTSFKIFSDNDPLRLGGATAFFTMFALPAILFLILLVLRLAFSAEESNAQLFEKLARYVGKDAANHLFNVLTHFEAIATNPLATIFSFLFLLFVATTLFKVIKNSLNDLWDIKVVDKMSVKLVVRTRSRELAIIASAGLFLMLSLFFEGVQMAASEQLASKRTFFNSFLGDIVSFIISTVVVTGWFGLIFCYLPDARVPLKIGFTGALLTSVLFNLGKILLRYLLFDSNLNKVFGASASVVLLLLFVFYSSMIFYYGAAFTKALAIGSKVSVKPLSYAAHYTVKAYKKD
jgi:membrane protein